MLKRRPDPGPVTRSVSNIAFAIGGGSAFDDAVSIAAGWLRQINEAVPGDETAATGFDIGGGGNHPARASRVDFEGGRMWAAIVDNPDGAVLGRTWITEIVVGENADGTHFGARLLNVTRQEDRYFSPSIPRVVRDMVTALPCMADGVSLSASPIHIMSDRALTELVTLIENPARTLPVVAVAKPVNRPQAADPRSLARRLAGAAHVVELGEEECWSLTHQVGRQLSVFDGAARIYTPGLIINTADPYDHPLWIRWHADENASNEGAIVRRVLTSGISKGTTGHPRYDAVRQAASAIDLKKARADASEPELIKLYEIENARLTEQLDELRAEQNQWLDDAEKERAAASRLEAELKADVARLRSQAEMLRIAITSGTPAVAPEPLKAFEDFGEWTERNISSNVWFAPKAIKEVERNGQYREPAELGDVLRLMDEQLVPARRASDQERNNAYLQGLVEMGCEDTQCFTKRNDILRYPEYAVTYRGEKRWCDRHIKHGGGADPRQMFRIYYHWDEEDRVVLIGHLPSHLDNNHTN